MTRRVLFVATGGEVESRFDQMIVAAVESHPEFFVRHHIAEDAMFHGKNPSFVVLDDVAHAVSNMSVSLDVTCAAAIAFIDSFKEPETRQHMESRQQRVERLRGARW
jgi:hypothetical protein